MPCPLPYELAAERIWEPEREKQNETNVERDAAFERLEAEMQAGVASIETNPMTGESRIVGMSAAAKPNGMNDLCVMAGLQTRNSLAWQTASATAGVRNTQFAAAHAHAHTHGRKH